MSKINIFSRLGLVITFIIVMLFLYAWQKIQIFRLGYRIRETEKELEKVKEKRTLLQLEISRLSSPHFIKQEVERLGLDIKPSSEAQIIRVK